MLKSVFCTSAPAEEVKKDSVDPLSFVISLEIPEVKADDNSKNTAQVNDGALVSFTSNLIGQQKDDVQNSVLLAQLAANVEYNRTSQTEEWYNYFQNVLQNVGWIITTIDFKQYTSETEQITIPTFVMDIITGLVSGWASGAEVAEMVNGTIAVLNSPAGADAQNVFGTASNTSDGANFQILACDSIKGQVTTAFIGSHMSGTQDSANYFFATYQSTSLDIFYNNQVMTLDEDVYSKVRKAVITKLGNNAKTFVKDLPTLPNTPP